MSLWIKAIIVREAGALEWKTSFVHNWYAFERGNEALSVHFCLAPSMMILRYSTSPAIFILQAFYQSHYCSYRSTKNQEPLNSSNKALEAQNTTEYHWKQRFISFSWKRQILFCWSSSVSEFLPTMIRTFHKETQWPTMKRKRKTSHRSCSPYLCRLHGPCFLSSYYHRPSHHNRQHQWLILSLMASAFYPLRYFILSKSICIQAWNIF